MISQINLSYQDFINQQFDQIFNFQTLFKSKESADFNSLSDLKKNTLSDVGSEKTAELIEHDLLLPFCGLELNIIQIKKRN